MLRTTALVLAASISVSLSASEVSPHALPDRIAIDNVLVSVTIPRPGEVLRAVDDLARAVNPELPADWSASLLAEAGLGEVATDRPWLVVVQAPAAPMMPPGIVVAVPATQAPILPGAVQVAGPDGYALLGWNNPAPAFTEQVGAAVATAGANVSSHLRLDLDLATVNRIWGAFLPMGAMMAERGLANMEGQPFAEIARDFMRAYMAGLAVMMAESNRLCMDLSLRDGLLIHDVRFEALDGSPLASSLLAPTIGTDALPSLLAVLPALDGAPVARFGGRVHPELFGRALGGLTRRIAAHPIAAGRFQASSVDGIVAILESVRMHAMAGVTMLDESGGQQQLAVARVDGDPATLIAVQVDLMKSLLGPQGAIGGLLGQTGITMRLETTADARVHAGVAITAIEMMIEGNVDLVAGQLAGMPMRQEMAAVNGHFVSATKPDLLNGAIDRLLAGPPAAAEDPLLPLLAVHDLVGLYDLGLMAQAMINANPVMAGPLLGLSAMPPGQHIIFSTSVAPGLIHGELRLPLTPIMEVIRGMQGLSPAAPADEVAPF